MVNEFLGFFDFFFLSFCFVFFLIFIVREEEENIFYDWIFYNIVCFFFEYFSNIILLVLVLGY